MPRFRERSDRFHVLGPRLGTGGPPPAPTAYAVPALRLPQRRLERLSHGEIEIRVQPRTEEKRRRHVRRRAGQGDGAGRASKVSRRTHERGAVPGSEVAGHGQLDTGAQEVTGIAALDRVCFSRSGHFYVLEQRSGTGGPLPVPAVDAVRALRMRQRRRKRLPDDELGMDPGRQQQRPEGEGRRDIQPGGGCGYAGRRHPQGAGNQARENDQPQLGREGRGFPTLHGWFPTRCAGISCSLRLWLGMRKRYPLRTRHLRTVWSRTGRTGKIQDSALSTPAGQGP